MNGKKSFVLYTDLIHTVEQLPDQEAGVLFKHILDYVNDKNPATKDLIIKIAFEPIKQQLKRDLQNWLKMCEKNTENGKKGGRPKKPKKPKKPTGLNGNPTKPKKPDNVNDTVNDSENVKKDIKQQYGEFTFLTTIEYSNLCEKHTENNTKKMIEILDNYKGSSGKKYKSDYRAILSWVVDRLNGEKETGIPKNNFGVNYRSTSNPYDDGSQERWMERKKEKDKLAKAKWEKEHANDT